MKNTLLAGLLSLSFLSAAHAGSVTYNFRLNAPNGYPITDLVLYAAGDTQDAIGLSPIVLGPSGLFQLTQTVAFEPTKALVLGLTERDKDDWWDILFFTSKAYASSSLGKRYDTLFPSSRNLGHNQLSPAMKAAHQGDLAALGALSAFLRGPDAAAAYFDPKGPFSIIQFSIVNPPIGGSVPEPGTLALVGAAILGLAVKAARRRRP